ncbi:MAG: MurT ligase domain-containing protein [Erysipelotrichaceae bacterium]|nr:MurT ligase domain-containing protein [Erysipelotrichaceae bacterium]MDD3924363.1 MurT ligase domain-containing protein [Erysipelotrichaceae bacterium]MDD4643277.1 MurT ligase domain-containing protein [Erysipelotrichaceae bacterium]
MRFMLALLLAKILASVGRLTKKGTNLPGDIALKIDKHLLGKITFTGKVIAITGSNGKTSTTNMLTYILKEAGFKVVSNQKGSNLTGGVATTLLSSANLKGRVVADFVILEVDERYSRLIFKDFSADYLLCTNLFRDQLTRNGNVDVIINKLHEAIKPTVSLILNANDPISTNLAPNNKRVYYHLNRSSISSDKPTNITHDAKVCPLCMHRLDYNFYHYNHIGDYYCHHCGYQTPLAKYNADIIDLDAGTFKVNNHLTKTNFKSIFNIINTTAAIATACELGLDIDIVTKIMTNFNIMEQRYHEFLINDRKAMMILSKNQNPVSYDQSIDYLNSIKEPKTVIIVVNNINHTYHKDTTWLYDVSFEKLLGNVANIICCGERAYDLAVRLKLAGFSEETMIIKEKPQMIKNELNDTKGMICFLTELYDAKTVINAVK